MATGVSGGDIPVSTSTPEFADIQNERELELDENGNALGMSTASEDELCATLESKDITALAKTLIAMSEELNKPERRMPRESPLGRLQRYVGVSAGALNEALQFLESPTGERLSQYLANREGILRGVKNIEELASAMLSICLIYLATKFLELGEDSYKAERNYIKKCLSDVEKKQDKIGNLVDEAAKILQEIVHSPFAQSNHSKAYRFDNVVREARLEIESCRTSLSGAEDAIQNLLWKVQGRRVLVVGTRYACLAGALYGLYRSYYRGSIGLSLLVGSSAGLIGLAAFLGTPYAHQIFQELVSLQYRHKYAKEILQDLDKRLQDHWQHLRKVRRKKTVKTQTPNSPDEADGDKCTSLPF